MDIAALAEIFSNISDEDFVDARLLSATPWAFREDPAEYGRWRERLGQDADLDPTGVFIVGSAATGYSLSPLKLGRDFRPLGAEGSEASDIDLAVVAPPLFFKAWNVIVAYDQDRILGFNPGQIRQQIYWGFVSNVFVPANTEPSRHIRRLLAASARHRPFRGYKVSARVYRRLADLRAYHIFSLRQVRAVLG